MWAIPTGTSSVLKKKNQVKSPSIWSRVPETGSDPPIGSDRDSRRDKLIEMYISEIFRLHGIPISIILDIDPRFN